MRIFRRYFFVACLIALGLAGPAHAFACTGGASLKGYYGLLVQGNSLTSTQGGKYLSGRVHFNGNCRLSGTNIYGGVNGSVGSYSATGTYSQNADFTIFITLQLSDGSAPQTYTVGHSYSTNEAVGIETDGSASATIDLQAQGNTGTVFSNSSLNSTYAVVCYGLGASKDDLNLVTFDGAGNLSGINPYDVNGNIGDEPYTGNYTVNADGTFQGTLNGDDSVYSFNGVIDNKSNEVQYIYNQSSVGEIVGCTGKR